MTRLRTRLALAPPQPPEPVPSSVDVALHGLSRSANKGRLWFSLAAVGLLARGRTRRAAIRGAGSLAAASLVVNAAAKPLFRRHRPDLELTPLVRRLTRQPWTASFPSGHAASAAAFTCGAALEHRAAGLAVAPIAGAVAYSRIHVGVHHVSDVLAGAALGAGVALATQRWWPVQRPGPVSCRTTSAAPALQGGKGMIVIVNPKAGGNGDGGDRVRGLLGDAEVIELTPELDIEAELDRRAAHVRALGVAGGDGTAASLAPTAIKRDLPMAVFPGGTMNHFARDIGVESFDDAACAIRAGQAVAVDVATAGGVTFLNTSSLGAYPEIVRRRDALAKRFGKWPAMVFATCQVLRRQQPLPLTIDGNSVDVWSVFVGNGQYAQRGPAPVRRKRLDDGLLDVQYLRVGTLSRTRAVFAVLAGVTEHSRSHRSLLTTTLRVESRAGEVEIARDGEPGESCSAFEFDKQSENLVIYRPLDGVRHG